MNMWLKLGVGLAALTFLAALPPNAFAADAAHPTVVELRELAGAQAVALDPAVDHHLRRIDALAAHGVGVGVLARRPGGL